MTVTIAGLLLMSVQSFAQAPSLGTAADFVLFSTVGAVGNTGISHVTGNVGTNSGAITGFGNVNGVMNTSNGATAQCAADLLIAYNQLNSAIPNYFPAPLLGNGQILGEGVYSIAGPTTLNNELTLDAQNDPEAVFIFQINGALSTAALSAVTLINGAQACNVFWKIEGLVDMATGTTMRGTVIANNGAISINADGVLEGRALSTSGAVNVTGVLVYTPIGCGSPVLMGPAAPDLVSAGCYAIFSGNGPVSNAGITNVIGDVGTNVGLTTGFDPLLVNGMIHPIPDGSTAAAAADLLNAYNYLNTLPFDIELLYPAQFGNDLVLTPHTYLLNAATTFIGDLYLNAGGQEDAVFVIQINGALTTSTYANVILMDGTKPENVFWKVDGAVAINDYSNFVGTIVANNGAVDLTTGVTLEGRAFTTTGALSTASVTVNMPPGCGDFTAPEIITQPEDQTVCMGESATFTVVAEGLNLTYQWRKGLEELSDGGNLSGTTSNVFTINPASLSDDASDYNVVVSGTYLPDAISEDVSLTVQPLPENVSAGNDANTCATCPYTFSEATAESYSSLLWTTSGDGEFDDETALNPVYTPGLTDPGTTVILCLSVNPIAPCEGLPVEDCMELEVLTILLPTANAGNDQTICEDQIAELAGEAENYSSVMWSTSGDGEFSSLISLITTYTPGAEDILAGVVELCLTAELILPGIDPAVDCMTLTILGFPDAYAGADAAVCATCPHTLIDATAENYSSLLWTTSGDGEFDDETALNPVYTPGLTDPGTTVILCLSVNPIVPCEGLPVEDCMELEVLDTLAPFADAGDNQTICENQLAELAGETYNYSSVMWSTSGDGEFSAENSLITDYTPGTADISAGTAELCLTATLDGAVPVSDVDCMTLTILGLPDAYAGADATVCAGELFQLAGAFVENASDFTWSTDGLGSFDDPLAQNPTYDPTNDVVGENVTLCLTAQAIAPCVGEIVNCIELFIQPGPTAYAGNNAIIQTSETYFLFEAMAANYAGLLWETSGDGTFNPSDDILQPTYIPGNQDISDGEVLLTLNAFGLNNCDAVTHSLILTIESIPPTVEIQSPVDGAYINSSPLLVEGIANDVDGSIAFVEVRINGGQWLMANGAEIWSIEVQPEPCFNTIEARATDSQGLQSEIDEVTNIEFNAQLLQLKQGWSYISSYIETADPNLFTLLDYIIPANSLVIMINDDGKIFWPSQNLNSLGSWNNQLGYKAKSAVDATWLLAGNNTANQTITLNSSYNIFPVLSNVSYALPGDFDDEDILLIFEIQTQKIYWPDGGLFTLEELKPGFGYLGNFYNSFDITFDPYVECDAKTHVTKVKYATNNSPWQFETTANVHLISLMAEAVAELDNPSFIGAFDAGGICIGFADVSEKADNYLMVVYGDEESTTEKDGALSGEPINLRAYNGLEKALVATYDMSQPVFNGTYQPYGVSKITSLKESSTGVGSDADAASLIKIFPNPASDMVNITSNVNIQQIRLINLTGQTILDYPVSGTHVQVNLKELVSGLYFIKIETIDNDLVTKRLSIR